MKNKNVPMVTDFHPEQYSLPETVVTDITVLNSPESKGTYLAGYLYSNPENGEDLLDIFNIISLRELLPIIKKSWKDYPSGVKNGIVSKLLEIADSDSSDNFSQAEAKELFSFSEMLAAEHPRKMLYVNLLYKCSQLAGRVCNDRRYRLFAELSSYYCPSLRSYEDYCNAVWNISEMMTYTKGCESLRDMSYLLSLLLQRLMMKRYGDRIIYREMIEDGYFECIYRGIFENCEGRHRYGRVRGMSELDFEELIVSNHCPEIVRLFDDPKNHYSAAFVRELMEYSDTEASYSWYMDIPRPLVEINADFCRSTFRPRRETEMFATDFDWDTVSDIVACDEIPSVHEE